MIKKGFLLSGICVVVILSGCHGEEPVTTLGADSSSGGGVPMAVHILPDHPTTADNLRAVVRNVGRIDAFRWRRNDSLISDIAGDELSSSYFEKGDIVNISVISGDKTAEANTVIGNTPPEIVSADFVDPLIRSGFEISVIPKGKDIDGDPVHFRYIWTVDGEELFWNDSPTLPADQVRKDARISLQVIPSDGEDEGPAFQSRDFSVPNSPPGFITTPPTSFQEDRYVYEATATDPDGDMVTYSLVKAPPGMSIDNRVGRIIWQVGRDDAGEHHIHIEARDEEGLKANQEFSLIFSFPE